MYGRTTAEALVCSDVYAARYWRKSALLEEAAGSEEVVLMAERRWSA